MRPPLVIVERVKRAQRTLYGEEDQRRHHAFYTSPCQHVMDTLVRRLPGADTATPEPYRAQRQHSGATYCDRWGLAARGQGYGRRARRRLLALRVLGPDLEVNQVLAALFVLLR